jgi:PAS domain S-box-containing protein
MKNESVIPSKYLIGLAWALALFGLYLSSLHSYLLFHSLAEIFSIVVACAIFMVAWNSRQFLDNNYLLFIGISYLFVGGLDLLHTLAYKGMGVFQGYGANLATQLWIATRYIESLSLLIAPVFIRRKLRPSHILTGYSLVTAMVLGTIFYWRIFPDCFVAGVGLTPFKKISEYLISVILAASIALLVRKQKAFDRHVLRLLLASICLTIAAELAFTFYVSVYGISNLFGHFCKIISFYLIYKAIIETGLRKPYDLLFRDLKQSEEALRGSEAILRQAIDLVPHAIYANDRNGVHLLANRKAAELLGTTVEKLTGALFKDVFHNQEQLNHFLTDTRKVIDTGQSQFIPEEPLTDADGTLQFLQTTKIPFDWPATGERVVLGVSAVITAQKKAEEALRKAHSELERRVEERTAELVQANEKLRQQIEERKRVEQELAQQMQIMMLGAEIGMALARGDTLRTLLQPCAEAMVKQFDAAFARIWTFNDMEDVLELHASAGIYTRIDGSRSRVVLGDSKIGVTAQKLQPIMTNAIIGDPLFIDQEWVKREGMVAFASYPLVLRGTLMGVMAIFARKPLADTTLRALASVSDQIALGIRRQWAEEALKKSREELRLLSSQLITVQEDERRRIAQELHDEIGQSLGSIKIRLETLTKQGTSYTDTKSVELLQSLISMVQESMQEVRNIGMDLRPSTLDTLGILATIAWFSREFQTTYPSLRIERQIDIQETEVPESLKIVIYRILQEALNNIAKHSKADVGKIFLGKTDGEITFSIQDNGQGLDLPSVENAGMGFGLTSMRERVELSGGSFSIGSSVGEGTTVQASWKL